MNQCTKSDEAGIARVEAQKAETAAREAAEQLALSGIRFIGDMQRLEVKPDDVYVLKLDRIFSEAQEKRFSADLKRVLGSGAKIICLYPGCSLGVMGAMDKMAGEPMKFNEIMFGADDHP